MSFNQTPNLLYDLSNSHFNNTTLITLEGKEMQGQFVQFKVVKGRVEYLYPAEKYCFLSKEFHNQFWNHHASNNGEFNEFPPYVIELSMRHIKEIKIIPALVPGSE